MERISTQPLMSAAVPQPLYTRIRIGQVMTYAALIILAVFMLLPFLWMVSASLKLDQDVFRVPIQWIPTEPRWSNFATIWTRIPFLTFFGNSLKLTVIITLLQLFTSSFAAYALQVEISGA